MFSKLLSWFGFGNTTSEARMEAKLKEIFIQMENSEAWQNTRYHIIRIDVDDTRIRIGNLEDKVNGKY